MSGLEITIEKHIPASDLVGLVHRVPLKNKDVAAPKIYPYVQAVIDWRSLAPSDVNPTSKYVLKNKLDFTAKLRDHLLLKYNVDTFALDGGFVLRDSKDQKEYTIIPPIVEVSEEGVQWVETRGDIAYETSTTVLVPIIMDGLHRMYVAKEQGLRCTVLFINNVPREYPFYALPNKWSEVRAMDSVPSHNEKKNYRLTNPFSLFRDLDVLGCGGPRDPGSK